VKELPSLSTPVHVIDDVAEDLDRTIERLAKLRPAEYDRVKKDEAGKLGITVKALDAEIRIKQKEKEL